MPIRLQCVVLCVAALLCAPVARAAGQVDGAVAARVRNELVLAGGALHVCSSLALRDCTSADVFDGSVVRHPFTHVFDAPGIAALDRDPLWARQRTQRTRLMGALRHLVHARAAEALTADAMRDLLEATCVDGKVRVARCRASVTSPFAGLDDDGQSMVLAAFEVPQRDARGLRRVERASLEHSRNPHGVAVLHAFVNAARSRTGSPRPRIALVTASAFDPFDPVDMYRDALRQAGADVVWWPLDAALARAVFGGGGCDALPMWREEQLGLPRRAHVYPDLHARQLAACRDPDSLVALPDSVHGVFFTGGDQWRLRRAFFDGDDAPNAWLRALRTAVQRGDVVIGGTSAGSAVQSGAAMLSNGTPAHAVAHGAVASPPPAPGCTRAQACIDGLDEDTMTFWPAGGLGLAPGFIVDTHFSQRNRELRLLQLLTRTGTRWGLGADETSALHATWSIDGRVRIDAVGASGGWVFDARDACVGADLRVNAHLLAPGAQLRIGVSGAASLVVDAAAMHPPTAHVAPAGGDDARAVLRSAARRLANAAQVHSQAPGLPRVTLERGPGFRAWNLPDQPIGVFDIVLRVADWGACAGPRRL